MKPKKQNLSTLYTFPMYVWLKGDNPWHTDSIVVNGITITTNKTKIYTMQDFIRLNPIMAYIGKEAILNEEHSVPTMPVTETNPYPVKTEEIILSQKKIKEELPKDTAYTIDLPQMKIVEDKEEKKEEKKPIKKAKKEKEEVKEESLFVEDLDIKTEKEDDSQI